MQFEGLAPWVREIEVVGTAPMDLGQFTLEEGVAIEGIVVDASGMPVPAATVSSPDAGEAGVETGADGRFRLAALPKAIVSVSAIHSAFVQREVRVDLRHPTLPLRIQLERGSFVTMRVRAQPGVAIPENLSWRMLPGEPGSNISIANGSFGNDDEDVRRVPAGRYRIELLREDAPLMHEDVVLEERKDVTVDLFLPGT